MRGLQASTWTLFASDCWRATLRLRRDMTFVALWGIISALVGALLGVIYWQQVRARMGPAPQMPTCRSRSTNLTTPTTRHTQPPPQQKIQASESWRNLLGLVFALVVADLFMGSLGIIMRFPSEWAIIVREYYAGTNAVGPYLVANFTCTSPMIYGPIALVTLVYWLTGACGCPWFVRPRPFLPRLAPDPLHNNHHHPTAGMDKDFLAYLKFVGIYITMDISCMSLGQFVSSLSANPMVAMTIRTCRPACTHTVSLSTHRRQPNHTTIQPYNHTQCRPSSRP